MARGDAKTVRFARIVERAGRPHVHTLWLPPDKDPELKRAVKAHRVMTVAPTQSGSTDKGTVGFDAAHAREAQFLIFPRSLRRFDGARVVGIKFDLVEQPKLAAGSELTRVTAKSRRGHKRKHVSVPAVHAAEEPPDAEASPAENVVAFAPKATKETREDSRGVKRAKPSAPAGGHALVREVRAALKELKAGKTVAAYQRLEHALEGQ